MATSISKNLSHRRLIKQKTHQLLNYQYCVPKTAKNLQLRPSDITNTLASQRNLKDHQTSINLDGSLDTSLSKRLNSRISSKDKIKPIRNPITQQKIKSPNLNPRRPYLTKFKSVETLPRNKQISPRIKNSFSVKKLSKNFSTASQPKLASMENLEIVESSKKVTDFQYQPIPKSQTDLKQTLKKTSSSKLKLKVKDPFQKRVKLQKVFQDQSAIQKVDDDNMNMMETVDQEQFRDLLAKII